MTRGANFSPEHQSRASHARWAQITAEQRVAHLRAVAAGMLRKAAEIEAEFAATRDDTGVEVERDAQ